MAYKNFNLQKIEISIRELLSLLGENPSRDGLLETPKRVTKMYKEVLSGYSADEREVFKFFDAEKYEGVVRVKNIFFSSFCEHHMIPFFGTVDIEYQPNGRIIGLSKFARLVDIYTKRLQVQERLTKQILDSIVRNLSPKYCKVTIHAEHLCMVVRGIKRHGSSIVTEKVYYRDEKRV